MEIPSAKFNSNKRASEQSEASGNKCVCPPVSYHLQGSSSGTAAAQALRSSSVLTGGGNTSQQSLPDIVNLNN